MSVFIVGGDYLGDIDSNFKSLGYDNVIHFKGRKKVKKRDLNIPGDACLVVVLTNYINHNIALLIKEKAKDQSVPVIFARRSWSCIAEKLNAV